MAPNSSYGPAGCDRRIFTWFGVVGGCGGTDTYSALCDPIVEHEQTLHARTSHTDIMHTSAKPFTNGLRTAFGPSEPFVIQWATMPPSPVNFTLRKKHFFILNFISRSPCQPESEISSRLSWCPVISLVSNHTFHQCTLVE